MYFADEGCVDLKHGKGVAGDHNFFTRPPPPFASFEDRLAAERGSPHPHHGGPGPAGLQQSCSFRRDHRRIDHHDPTEFYPMPHGLATKYFFFYFLLKNKTLIAWSANQ